MALAAVALPARAFGPRAESTVDSELPFPRNHRFASTVGRFSLPKPSWIVRSESNVLKIEKQKPNPPCSVCNGIGRIACYHCQGRGRTNYVHLAMLPKGEWPKWCKICGGSGLGYCTRCLGTGEYRDVMGFHFMRTGIFCHPCAADPFQRRKMFT